MLERHCLIRVYLVCDLTGSTWSTRVILHCGLPPSKVHSCESTRLAVHSPSTSRICLKIKHKTRTSWTGHSRFIFHFFQQCSRPGAELSWNPCSPKWTSSTSSSLSSYANLPFPPKAGTPACQLGGTDGKLGWHPG